MPSPPTPGEDIQAWLVTSTVRFHDFIRRNIGRAFWDLHVERPRISDDVAERIAEAPVLRREYATVTAKEAWRALGAEGEPPEWVIDAFALYISGFATYAHPEQSAQQTGALSARLLWLVLQEALRKLAWSSD